MYSSFKGPANVRDKQPVFESFGERQFSTFDETKHAPPPVWNVHSQPYNNVRIYPGDQLNIKLQNLTAHNQTVIPEQRTSAHTNSLQCPYPNNNQTVVRPTAVINCHSSGTSCCGHPNRVPHHWNTVPPNVPPPRHFVDNISLYNNHSNLNSEDYRFRADTYYAPVNKQVLSHRDNSVVNQPSFYSGPLRGVQGLAPVYDVKLPAPLPVNNRGKYAGNKVARSEPCAKCSGNCNESCELYGGQDIVDYSSADPPNEFVRENVACYSGLHPEAAGPATQYCTQWATNTTSQTEYCRQNNNATMWMHNSHSAISGNNLASNCWMDKKDLLSGNCLSQYTHHPSATQQNTRPKDTQDSLKLPEMRVNDLSCMQPPQLINGYPEVLHQDKEKVYNGNFCNHVPGRRVDETQNKLSGPYFKDREVIHSQTVPPFSHLKQIKNHDFSLNGAPSMPQERVIFQESQTFTSTIGSHSISVPSFAQPNVLHPYNKNTTKSCFQNAGSAQLHTQDVAANSFSLCKVTEAFTTGIAQPPSRFSSHLTYTQSRISKANNEFSYFQDYDNSANVAPNASTADPAIPSVGNSLSPKVNPVNTPTCVSDSQPTFSTSDDSKIDTSALHPAIRNEHNFNRNAEYIRPISDLQSCKRLQENNITGKLMQVIDASTSNVQIGIRECTDISSNDTSNIMVKNISSYSSEYNIYSGNIPPGSGSAAFNTSTGNVDFPGTQMLTNFDPYSKQFGPGQDGPDVLSSSGPIISSVGESEVTGSNKVIQPDFGTENFCEAAANPQIKRNFSHVNDVIKSEYRTLHSAKQKCQKVGQLDVRQFLATWDEETEDVASPRLPDVVLSSNGTPLFVVECGGGNLNEISPVITNSASEETVHRNGVIVYEHIQPMNTVDNITEHTHAGPLANRNKDGLQVNVVDDSVALENNDCILLRSSISECETVQSDSNVDAKQHVQKNIAPSDVYANKEGNSSCLTRNKSAEDNTESVLPSSTNLNTTTRETLSPIIFSKVSISDLQDVHSQERCVSAEETSISAITTEKNEEKQSCDDVQGTSENFLQKTDPVPPDINFDAKNVSCEPLYECLKDGTKVKNCESDLSSELPNGTKLSDDEVMTSSRNSNLDDIAVDAFEKLTNGKRAESALKCRYIFSESSTSVNTDNDSNDYSYVSRNENELFDKVYINSCHQPDSKSDEIESTENKNVAERSNLCIENIRIHNSACDKNTFVDKCTHAKNFLTGGCAGSAKEAVLEKNCANPYPISYRTFKCTVEERNKGIVQCYDEVPQSQTDKVGLISINTTMQTDSNINVKNGIKCDYETVTPRHKREVNGNSTSSFITDKYESLERCLAVHNPFCPQEIPEGMGNLSPKCTSIEKRSLLSFSNNCAILNRTWQSSGTPSSNIVPNFRRARVAHLSSNGGNVISARTTMANEVISVSCECFFSNQSVSDSIFTRAGTKSFLLPVEFLFDRATMNLIRKKLFSGKHLKTHIKGTLDSSKTRFLTNDKTLSRKDVLQSATEYSHHIQLLNEGAHGSDQMNARFSFAPTSANHPGEKVHYRNRHFTTVFGDSDEMGLSLFLKQYFQDDNQGNYNRSAKALKVFVQQSGKGRSCNERLCFAPTFSEESDGESGTEFRNVSDVSNLPLMFINSNVLPDELIHGQSAVLQNLETGSICFNILDSCVRLWLHNLGYNDYTHSCKNVPSINFQEAPVFQESSECTRHKKNVSKLESNRFSRYDFIGKKLLKNNESSASTTSSEMLHIKDQMCTSDVISCVYGKKAESNHSVNGCDMFATLLSIKNKLLCGNYQMILSKYLFKSLCCDRIDMCPNSTIIRKLNTDSAEQEDRHHNGKSIIQEGSSIHRGQVIITELTSQNQELLPLKSFFREIDTNCLTPTAAFIQYEAEEEITNKVLCNGVSDSEKGRNNFFMETTSYNSLVNDKISGGVMPGLPCSSNIITEKCPVPIHHDSDVLRDNESAVMANASLPFNEMYSCTEQHVSVASSHKTNKVDSKAQNSKLELIDESEVVISSTSTLEEASADVDCDFNEKAGSLFLFEDELPCVESYVDADDVTVVSGTHDDGLDEENDIAVPCVVVYPENNENMLHSEENVSTHISSVDGCSESDIITTAIISDDVCMNSNCVIISEDESSRQSPQNLLMGIVPCSSQEDSVEFRRFSTECTDEYQNSTVSSTTHINEISDSNRLKSVTTVLVREDRENQNITTSDMHEDFSFFGEEVDYYNTGVLQADSVSDWPYLEEEVISELQNSDIEPEVPLGNIACEINSDKSISMSCSPANLNNLSVKNGLQYQNLNIEESSSTSKKNSIEENYTQGNNELIDLKCRLSWDKIFDLPRKDKCSVYKMKNRTRKTVTKSWPYYCKTQSRWKWPKSNDKLYRKMSKKLKEISVLPESKKQKGDCIGQSLEKSIKQTSDTSQLHKEDTSMYMSPPNTSSVKCNVWHVTNGNNSNPRGYKREKNNNYVIESVDSNSKADVLSNPIVLVQRLILKRNKNHSDHGAETRLDKKDTFSRYVCNGEQKAACSNPYKQGICKSDSLRTENTTDVCTHSAKKTFAELRENQKNIEGSYGSDISKRLDNNNKTFDIFKTDSIISRKKAKSFSVEVQHGKHTREVKKPNDKSVKKHSDECIKELPRVIIKRSPDGSTRYKSFLCLSAATEKYWQPVVMLKRDSDIEELAKRMQKRKFSSHVVGGSTQSNVEIPSEITGKAHKIKYMDSGYATVKKNSGKEHEWGAVDTCIANQEKTTRRKENKNSSEFKYSKCRDSNSLSINSSEPSRNIIEGNNVPDEQIELRCASVSDFVTSKSGKKHKGVIKLHKNFADESVKDCKRIHSECQEPLPHIGLSYRAFSDNEVTDISVSNPGEDNYKQDTNRCGNKHNNHESLHTSNNEERHSLSNSTSRDKILKTKSQDKQKSEKNSKKRHSEWTDSKCAKKKKCFWDSDYTKSVQMKSRSQQKCTNITVLSNEESHFPVHRRDEMTPPNARCSLIDQQVSLQNDELKAYKSGACSTVDQDGGKIDCQACGTELKNFAERSSHIRQHPYHCQRCHLAFKSEGDFVNHLSLEHPQTKEQHHCLLCEKSFTTSDKHQMHLQGRFHRYVELTQRRTIHTIFTLLTGKPCPGLPPLTDSEVEGLGWFPSEPGTVHFYHQATPLQMAVQGWLNFQRSKSDSGIIEENKGSECNYHSQ